MDRVVFYSLLLAAIVFAADLYTPLGVASGVPYTLAVLVALRAPQRHYAPLFATLCSVLTIADMFLGPGRGGTELWKVLSNRFLAVFMIWITAILGMMSRRAEEQRRRAEERNRLLLADLAHAGRLVTVGQMTAELAHELKQPLAAISMQSEVAVALARDYDGRNQQPLSTALQEITGQTQRIAAILRTLRDLVRKIEPRRSMVDLGEIVHEAVHFMEEPARRADVTLHLHLTGAPLVSVDKVQIEQVLLNLLQNALESIPANGAGPRWVDVTMKSDGGTVSVSVCDSGTGLSPEDLIRLFERFRSTKPSGLGLGLSISRSIVEAHGGRLWAMSNPDRGTTFTFTIPISGRI